MITLVDPEYKILTDIPENVVYKFIAEAGMLSRNNKSAVHRQVCENLMRLGHESVIEHVSLSVQFKIDRAMSHELVRHRIASYTQESQRYCNYSDNIEFIKPFWYDSVCIETRHIFFEQLEKCHGAYVALLKNSILPQDARGILPNATATSLIVTANLREWRHILKLRTSIKAHPDMRLIMRSLLKELKSRYSIIFDDINNF